MQPTALQNRTKEKSRLLRTILKNRWLYLLALPGVLYFVMFRYVPMFGLTMAFQDYSPVKGFINSEWVGFEHFYKFFTSPDFFRLFRNTFLIAIYNLVFFFPLPIILALMLNSVQNTAFKRIVQTITYMPHFLSWVIIVSIFYVIFTVDGGVINDFIVNSGGKPVNFLSNPSLFRPMIMAQIIWRETGWGTIIFLAALTGIDPQLYDAAHVDGANAWQRMTRITLPSISNIIITLLILRLGHFLDTGFSQIFLMLNAMNRSVGEVFDTYVYRLAMGQNGGKWSYTTAVGLFKSLVGLLLVIASDKLAKKTGNDGVL